MPRLLREVPQLNRPVKLTRRERQVATLIASGLLSKEVADRLHISVRTVESHRYSALHKLGCRTVADLVRWCIRRRLLLP